MASYSSTSFQDALNKELESEGITSIFYVEGNFGSGWRNANYGPSDNPKKARVYFGYDSEKDWEGKVKHEYRATLHL